MDFVRKNSAETGADIGAEILLIEKATEFSYYLFNEFVNDCARTGLSAGAGNEPGSSL
jgi:hypothetical protein